MKVAFAQLNVTTGAFPGNAGKIVDFAGRAHRAGAELILFPELIVSGYPSQDLLFDPHYLEEQNRSLQSILSAVPSDLGLVLGHFRRNPREAGKLLQNALSLFVGGRCLFSQAKTLLPNYDVFDEQRYFAAADEWGICEFRGIRLGFLICEDIWYEETGHNASSFPCDPVEKVRDLGAELVLIASASPYYPGKQRKRLRLLERVGLPCLYVNQWGGNDSLLFDGKSVCRGKAGILHEAGAFRDELYVVETEELLDSGPGRVWTSEIGEPDVPESPEDRSDSEWAELIRALVVGIRDYCGKSGFTRCHLGLSGGIDSALVAYLAAEALGPERVWGLAMPSRYSSEHSKNDAALLARNLGIRLEGIEIEPIFRSFEETLAPLFEGLPPGVAEENLQARIRGTLLMAFSNKFHSFLLSTGNKSELSTGYCTLYGDMNGSLNPVGDLWKTEIFGLVRAVNRLAGRDLIPRNILEKPPSAELRSDQKDTDTLPPYEILDWILRRYLLDYWSVGEICGRTVSMEAVSPETVERVCKMVDLQEYKRFQSPPILKVSPLSFGIGRRMPLVQGRNWGEDFF